MSSSESAAESVLDQSRQSDIHSDVSLPIPRKIQVRGDVKSPGEFSFVSDADIFHYLTMAGGALSEAQNCNLIIVRQYGEQRRSLLFRLDQKEYLPRIKQGDLIIISEIGQQDSATKRKFHKPAITAPHPKDEHRLQVREYEQKMPASSQALKRALDDYIRFPQFKRMLNQIAAQQAALGVKSIAVLSLLPGEGKSFFCAALSLAYARFLDSQVLLVDSNREPNGAQLSMVKGDYSALVPNKLMHSNPSFIDLVNLTEIERDYHENSDFYFGPYISSVRQRYDLILVDTCASSAVTKESVDPMIVASQVDAVIVINSGLSLDRKSIQKFSAELKASGAKVLGSVYNSGFQK